MFKAFVIGTALCTISISAFAQDNNLIGKWSGSYLYLGNLGASSAPTNVGVDLEITSVENNIVKGLAKQFTRVCRGEYPLLANSTVIIWA